MKVELSVGQQLGDNDDKLSPSELNYNKATVLHYHHFKMFLRWNGHHIDFNTKSVELNAEVFL